MGNEEALCNAVVRMLEWEAEVERGRVTYPERDGSGPPVEMRVEVADRRYAIEHTLVEPFPKAFQAGAEFTEFAAPLHDLFYGNMPKPGTYELIFPVHPTAGRHRREHAALRARIAAWVEEAAQALHTECPERLGRNQLPHGYQGTRTGKFEQLEITLTRRVRWSESDKHDGALFLVRSVGEDLEDQRLVRVQTSLARKLPKLLECGDQGDVTILILEWTDIALTNQIVLARALEAALADYPVWPDHIFLADTAVPGMWHFFQPVAQGQFSINMEYIDIDQSLSAT